MELSQGIWKMLLMGGRLTRLAVQSQVIAGNRVADIIEDTGTNDQYNTVYSTVISNHIR